MSFLAVNGSMEGSPLWFVGFGGYDRNTVVFYDSYAWYAQTIGNIRELGGYYDSVGGYGDVFMDMGFTYNGSKVYESTDRFLFKSYTQGWIVSETLSEPKFFQKLDRSVSGDLFFRCPNFDERFGTSSEFVSAGAPSGNVSGFVLYKTAEELWTKAGSGDPYGVYSPVAGSSSDFQLGCPTWAEPSGSGNGKICQWPSADDYGFEYYCFSKKGEDDIVFHRDIETWKYVNGSYGSEKWIMLDDEPASGASLSFHTYTMDGGEPVTAEGRKASCSWKGLGVGNFVASAYSYEIEEWR